MPDKLMLLDVYSAGEDFIEGADGASLINEIKKIGKTPPVFVERHDNLPNLFNQELKNGDILLMQGAGNIGALAARLAATSLKEATS
jgi:UDP-N-acetylmuramate--alanine ligase